MDVNSEIWGLPANWVTAIGFNLIEGKIPASGWQSFRDAYNNNRLDENTIDLSAAFYGISAQAYFAQPHFLACYNDGGVSKVSELAVSVPRDIPAMFTVTGDTTIYTRYAERYQPDVSTYSGNVGASAMLMSFNYQKIMLVPYVIITNDATDPNSQWWYSTLKDYVDTYYSSYHKLVKIIYRVYGGTGDGTDRQYINSGAGIQLLTTLKIDGQDLSYNDKVYMAYGGYSQLTKGEYKTGADYFGCPVTHYTSFSSYSKNMTVGDRTTALAYRYCETSGAQNYFPLYYYDDSGFWKMNAETPDGNNWQAYPYIDVSADNIDDVRDYVMQQIAYLGLPFVYDKTNALRGQIGDEGVFLPVFDENGITTGEYKEGRDAIRLPNSDWTDAREGSGYDPDKHNNDDFGYLFNPHNTNRFATGLTVWSMYQQDILDVLGGINNLYLTDPDGNNKWQLDFKGSNPDDYIVSCKAMLLDVAHSESTYAFKLGPVTFDGIGCYKYADTGYFSFGSIDINAYYGDFRDCQPYTSMELYIPLCGTVDIDPEYFTGHSMEIIMMYDVYTGACTAGIYRDHYTLYKAVNGQIGADIPVSALQMGTYQSTVHALQAAQKQNEIRLTASAVTVAAGAAALIAAPATGGASIIAGAGLISGAAGLLGGVMQEQNYDYQIEHTQPVPAQTTAAETQNNFCVGGLYPILYIKRAKMLTGYDAEIYSHTIGNACLINGYVGSQTGLVMCSAVDLSGVPATVEEINAIKQALGKGVYV